VRKGTGKMRGKGKTRNVSRMDKKKENQLKDAIINYFEEIQRIYIAGDFTEESFYPGLKRLIEECARLVSTDRKTTVVVVPKRTEVGIPDFLIKGNGEIIGYIEAKVPDESLRDVKDSEQLKKYRNSLPNLILTNFLEFWLYRHGNLVHNVQLGRRYVLERLKQPFVPKKLDSFFELLEKFFSFSMPEIRNSSRLSTELAKRTRFLEFVLKEELLKENKAILGFYEAFRQELIEGLTKERFADLYAQTITYGLFAARMKVKNGLKKELAWQFIPESLSLLREIFYSFTGPSLPESLSWVIDDIVQVLEKVDISSILSEFKTTKWDEDPVIHFYETFLATYNPEERERLGVYYTPLPVVSYIVRSIHKLLKNKFKKPEGLAARDVTLLDPAAGTLTFVVQAIKQVKKELEERNKVGLVKSYIEEHILPNFYAFEILMAPYTIGHFKVSMVLDEMGYKFKKGQRLQFYLTNTLEMKEPGGQQRILIELTREGKEAKKIKEKVPILVILGNPPYSVSSENKSEFIKDLMEDYKEDVKDERNIQPLSDDYIKFIRFDHYKIEQAGKGIIGIISNNSYLSGIIHRGMRKRLLETFDEIYILNLHGSSRIGERAPDGSKDENVFDIQQGVAIALYVKLERPAKEKKVHYADLWGLRKEKHEYLFQNDVTSTNWKELKPIPPYYFFVPKDFALQAEYEQFWKLTDIFRFYNVGGKPGDDKFLVAFNPNLLISQIIKTKTEIELGAAKLTETKRNFKKILPQFKLNKGKIIAYDYRPFDIRWTYYDTRIFCRAVPKLWKQVQPGNLFLITTRLIKEGIFNHAFVSKFLADVIYLSSKSATNAFVFPLYLYPDKPRGKLFKENETEPKRIPNFTNEFLQAIKESLGTESRPEQIFYYIYSVLYSPAYRKRYEEFLKIDFPRIPLPKGVSYFNALSNLGKELVDLHLLKHRALDMPEIGFPKGNSDIIVENVKYDEANKRVYINKTQYFEGISKQVWEYRIGSYQVMQKYLKDRTKKPLSLDEVNHYMKVAKAIRLTIELQKKIDDVYKKFI